MEKTISERIKGALLGYAVGDTLGKGTEFMTGKEASIRYPGGLRHYHQIINDAHRSQWDKNDFTLDTEIVLLLADTMVQNKSFSNKNFAHVLRRWYEENPFDLGGHIRGVICQPDFLENPIEASRRTLLQQDQHEAYNEALGRAMLVGFCKEDTHRKIKENCQMTHYDTRCVSTAVVIGEVANKLLWEGEEPAYNDLVDLGAEYDNRTAPYLEIARYGDLEDFHLDDEDSYWYTRKTMGAALWALWHEENAEQALYDLVDAAGDADTNAALGVALICLRDGMDGLPAHLVDQLKQKERVTETARQFAEELIAYYR